MNIGYACLTVGVPDTNFKSCVAKSATDEHLISLISHNLSTLENIIEYNHKNGIRLFRISSDLIPFGSSFVNSLPWWRLFHDEFIHIGQKIKNYNIRVSMHPGQYTVLNSPNDEVVQRSVQDFIYHTRVLDALGMDKTHKIITHIGGVYGDKKSAIERFIKNFQQLPDMVKCRLVIENDDKLFHIEDVLLIANTLQIPVVFDNLHNKLNSPIHLKDDALWITDCVKTWKAQDGVQKIHYSQQDEIKKSGAHSASIEIDEFLAYTKQLPTDIDVMLEVKDKNLSTVKCKLCTSKQRKIEDLEQEWRKYKYIVLEKSQADYLSIRELLKDKQEYPALQFYRILQHTLKLEQTSKHSENALLHVWGYMKDHASEKEKNRFFQILESYRQGNATLKSVKNYLHRLAKKYEQIYLLESYYFIL